MFAGFAFARRRFVSGIAVLAVVSSATLFTSRATAQTAVEAAKVAAEISRVASNLPPESRDVITRLIMLRELPGGSWKMHGGDLAHGEDLSLDESSWQTFAVPGTAPNDAVWFRTTYVVPDTLNGYDLTGSRVWFQFHADANGPMPEILYFNGRRVALGDDLEPVILFDNAKPGDKVTVAVKLLHTVDTKSIRGATLRIEFPESRPNPDDLRDGVFERGNAGALAGSAGCIADGYAQWRNRRGGHQGPRCKGSKGL